MKFNKKLLFASTVALSLFPLANAQADDWKPRTVADIKADLVPMKDGKVTYTVKYGDTLSTIAEAMGVETSVLAAINQIANVNLIFPDTVLTLSFDKQNNITGVEIQSPETTNSSEKVVASADLVANQVVVGDKTMPLEASSLTEAKETAPLQAPIAPVTANPSPVAETTEVSQETSVPETSQTATSPVSTESALTSRAEAVTSADSQPTSVSEPVSEEALSVEPAATTTEVAPATIATETLPPSQTAPVTEAPAVTEVTPVTEATPAVETVAETTEAVSTAQLRSAAPAATSVQTVGNQGLRPQAAAYKDKVANAYGITSFSTYRAGDPGDHGKGLAVDFMVPESSALGDQVAQDATSNMSVNKISYVIWKQRFYAPYPSKYGEANQWNVMPDRGSVTANHYDHVHVSFNE